jgi:hypothetical protein
MRKFVCVFIFMCLCAGLMPDAEAQINRKSVKKNNRRMSKYKGRKEWFAKNKRYNTIGFSVNALNYYGDLAPKPQRVSTDISFTRPALALSLTHRFGPRYTLLGQYMFGTLRGSDVESADLGDPNNGKFRYQRNLSFRNRLHELSVLAYFDLFENDATYISRVKWTPYAFVGLTGFLHNPQGLAPATDLSGNTLPEAGQYSTLDAADVNYGIKPYSKLQGAIPFGIGARFKINDILDLWADIGFRYTFTDYLDDVSQHYVDLGVLNSELAKAMSYRSNELPAEQRPPTQPYVGRDGKTYNTINGYGSEGTYNMRGSKSDRDIYMVTSIKLTYIVGKTFHRAKFR